MDFWQHLRQEIKEFDEAHGGMGVQVLGFLVFPDGAHREISATPCMHEPPEDWRRRCKFIIAYHESLVQRAVDEFKQLKENLRATTQMAQQNPHAYFTNSQADLDQLKELQAEVKRRRAKLTAVRKRLEGEKPEEIKHQEWVAALRNQEAAEFAAELSEIRI